MTEHTHIDLDDSATIARRIFGNAAILPMNDLHAFANAVIADALANLKQAAWRVEFTNGGFLLESKRPRNYLPGAGVKYVPLYELAAAPEPKEQSK